LLEEVHQGWEQSSRGEFGSNSAGKCVHGNAVRLTAVREALIPSDVFVDRPKDVAHVAVRRKILSVVDSSKMGEESSSSKNVLLDSSGLDLLAID
jgi:hypothetical protein